MNIEGHQIIKIDKEVVFSEGRALYFITSKGKNPWTITYEKIIERLNRLIGGS